LFTGQHDDVFPAWDFRGLRLALEGTIFILIRNKSETMRAFYVGSNESVKGNVGIYPQTLSIDVNKQ
jgi:hypothetical protein